MLTSIGKSPSCTFVLIIILFILIHHLTLRNHGKELEQHQWFTHRVMCLYLDEVDNYVSTMCVQTNNADWISFHVQYFQLV